LCDVPDPEAAAPAPRSTEPCRFQPFHHVATGSRRAELRGKALGLEERSEARDDRPLALSILLPLKSGISSGEHRTGVKLNKAAGRAREGTVERSDCVLILAEEVFRNTEIRHGL